MRAWPGHPTIALDDSIDTILMAMGAGGRFAKGVAKAIAEAAPGSPRMFLSPGSECRTMSGRSSTRRAFRRSPIFPWRSAPPRLAPSSARASGTARRPSSSCRLLLCPSTKWCAKARMQRIWTVAETSRSARGRPALCAVRRRWRARSQRNRRAGRRIGYPVVLKLSSPSLNHKSDEGGVALGLRDRDAVEAASGLSELATAGSWRSHPC